jgi:glycosyltransferase involved in cell wall biosynthesis
MPIQVLYLHAFQRIGGAERALLGLADVVRQMDVEPLVLWPRADRAFSWLRSRGVGTATLKVPPWRHGLSLPLLPLFLARLQRISVRNSIDVVHVNNYRSAPWGRFVAQWAGAPCVCHVREMITSEMIHRYRLRSMDTLIAVADAVGLTLIKEGIPQGRVSTIRSGVAVHGLPTQSEAHRSREGLRIGPNDPVVGIVAHILPHKGYDDLVQALALIAERLPNTRCLVVGEAPRKRYLRHLLDLAERHAVKDRLTLVGFREDVACLLQAMDLVVLPSHSEGLPITILEAMAAGKPVVATAVGGIPEVVRNGETGLLVPPRDPQRMAEAAIRLLQSPALARLMGEAGRKQVEAGFTLAREARETSMAYQEILASRSRDGRRVPQTGQG